MKHPWILPLIILALLITAWIFRWGYGAAKTSDTGVIKWKTDRWAGQGWIEIYSTKGGQGEVPSGPEYSYTNKPYVDSCRVVRKAWTNRWYAVTGMVSSWLFYAAWLSPWLRNKRSMGTDVKPPPTEY